jgi:hypothetical protein
MKRDDIAREFIQNSEENRLGVMCKYNILRDYEAFDIS